MDITLSLSPGAEAKLRERAAASGRDVAQYAAEIVERAVSEPTSGGKGHNESAAVGEADERLAAWDAFVASMREVGKRLPSGHVVDDSRESIYAGRGE